MPDLKATQNNRPFAVSTPLADDVLLFYDMQVKEKLGSLFQFDLKMLSKNPLIPLADLLGQKITLQYRPEGANVRYFNGYVSEFREAGARDDSFVYTATLHPWLWFLTRTTDCRIFQNKTVPEIVKAVFGDHDVSDFEEALTASYRKWENCVQYRETDFNFISRLLEQEGIYYYFKHANNKHTLVLADAIGAHQPVPGYETVPYYPPSHQDRERDHFYDWSLNRTIQSGVYALNDYDFKKPRANLKAQAEITNEHEQAQLEIYDYPGEYVENSEGDHYAKVRIEALQAQYEAAKGQGSVGGLTAGCTFKLVNFVKAEQNRDYLVTSVSLKLGPQEYQSVPSQGDSPGVSCDITAIDQNQIFRSPSRATKPVVQGPQTAVVVGPAGEEIWTDQYGRIKVQFHWDRYGKVNENSSCWMRVSHPWAGKNWGAVAIPRMGQEVIVSFMEGDPDRPMITGRVYNDDNPHPYDLPANATQSGVKTRSAKGGTPANFNELRFEDKKGSEELYIHAEKDQNNHVENDETTFVGHDRTERVVHDETITIGFNRTEEVGINESITIGVNRTESVGINENITIGVNRTESVGKNESISIGDNRSESVGENESINIGKNRSEQVGENETINIGKNQEITVGKNQKESVGKNREVQIGKNNTLNVGKKLNVIVGDQITLKCGKSVIIMKKDGKIQITGKEINIKMSGKIKIKGSKIGLN